jgi:hypothetical protein
VEPRKPGGGCEVNQLIYRKYKIASPQDRWSEAGLRGQFHRNPRRTKKKGLGAEPLPDRGAQDQLRGRCDSFVVETNVEYPTDTRLLFDSVRKVIQLLIRLCRFEQVEESIGG